MKAYSKLLAIVAVLALAIIPLLAVDGADATVNRQGQWDYSGFTDNDSGRLKVTLVNDAPDAVEIKLMVYETGNHDNVYTTKTVTVPANTENNGELAVELSWKFGSSGTKYVDVWAYNTTDDTRINNPLLDEDSVKIDVSHSIWKNTVTYVVIVIIAIVVIIVLVMYIRSTKKTKSDTTMSEKTFTNLHREKVGKKAATAEKKEYKSSGNKTRKK
jgi:hypothetical protein